MHAFTGFQLGMGNVKTWQPGFSGIRGLGLTCDTGYHSYTPDGVNFICQPDVSTVAAAYSNQVIAADAAANPLSVPAQFLQQYGGLTNAQQEKVIDCQEYVGANAITGAAIPAECAGVLNMKAPYVPNTNPISPPASAPATAVNTGSVRQVVTPRAGGGQITQAGPSSSPVASGGQSNQSNDLVSKITSWFTSTPSPVSTTNVNAPISTVNAGSPGNDSSSTPVGGSDANAVVTGGGGGFDPIAWVEGLPTWEQVLGIAVIGFIGYKMFATPSYGHR